MKQILYYDDGDLAVYNGYSFRRDKRTGYFLSTKQIGSARVRLHIYVWETENGKIPKGYEVHHKDHNKNNNGIDNLELLTSEEHHKINAAEMSEEQKQKSRDNLLARAIPKAVEWHKSAQGRELHKKHYEDMKEALHRKAEFVCEQCGKTFTATAKGRARFCSNNCKAMYRRLSGMDDVERTCPICGIKYKTNKYSPARYCPEHKGGKCRDRRI
jgi:rubrerythrin